MNARLGLVLLAFVAGCSGRTLGPKVDSVAETLPPASVAAPWILQDEIWTGAWEAAAPALGDDADEWGRFEPQRVWLAIYRHESDAQRRMTVRAFAFRSADEARRAYEFFRPHEDAEPFEIGDGGAWTDLGVLFAWGRLVFEIFGDRPTWSNQLQAVFIGSVIEKRMPPALPEDPR